MEYLHGKASIFSKKLNEQLFFRFRNFVKQSIMSRTGDFCERSRINLACVLWILKEDWTFFGSITLTENPHIFQWLEWYKSESMHADRFPH